MGRKGSRGESGGDVTGRWSWGDVEMNCSCVKTTAQTLVMRYGSNAAARKRRWRQVSFGVLAERKSRKR
jgi:hypothetical protein